MNKAKMVEVVRESADCSVAGAQAAVDALFKGLTKALKKEGSVTIVGFGTFKVSKRGARKGRNPRTGEPIKIAASKSVRFKASKSLRSAI
jgi:DNA-binding protein HU-beta